MFCHVEPSESFLHKQMACLSLSVEGHTRSHNKKYMTHALAYQVTEIGHLFTDHLMIMHLAIKNLSGVTSKCFLKDFVLGGVAHPTTPVSLYTSI